MDSTLRNQTLSVPKSALFAARAIGVIAVLFLAFDAVGKFLRPAPVVDAFARLGMSVALAPVVGAILLALVVLYVVPQLRVFAAILITGYLGGAVAVQLRARTPAFETLFPILMGVLVWAPLYLVDERVRALIPLRR